MIIERLGSIVSRILFFGSFLLLGIASLEKVVNLFQYTILRETYTPGRLLEWASVLLLFVLAIILRQVREEVRKLKIE